METHETKYIRELSEYFSEYMAEAIDEIFIGVGMSLGLTEKEAYDLAKNRPGELKKAGYFKGIIERLKKIFTRKPEKFRPKQNLYGKGAPMSQKQWDVFNRSIDNYWQKVADDITGDVTVKGYMLGRETLKFREKNKPFQNKSLYQVVDEQFDGKMPESIEEAYKNYDFDSGEKQAINKSFSSVATYVQETNSDIKDAIRQQVNTGIEENKSSIQIASDLYWNVQKDEELVNKHSAESLKKNWHRIAATEMASVYNDGTVAPYVAEAMESLKDSAKAKYFVRTGGQCKWCQSVQGTVVRLVPAEIVIDHKNESLKNMGIKDPNTDIAIWPGKNNVGIKQAQWMIACPAHPYNVAIFSPIDLETEYYNKEKDRIDKRQEEKEFVPQIKEYEVPEDYRTPKPVGDNLVRVGNNIYTAYPAAEADKRLEEWRINRSLPIPVAIGSPQYRRIFEADKKR